MQPDDISSLYPQPPKNSSQDGDPIAQITKVIQMKNLMDNVNKVRGGMPGTQGALSQLGAGQPYQPTPNE